VLVSYTRRLHDLPPPVQLYTRARALAMVELAINARPPMRWHTLDPNVERNVRISSGSGDEGSVWLADAGCVVRGFDHESELSPWMAAKRRIWPGLLDGFPADLAEGPRLTAYDGVENLTFVLWWHGDGPWQIGALPPEDPTNSDMDGSHLLLNALVSDDGALAFLSEYYEADMPRDLLSRFRDNNTFDPRAIMDLPNRRPLDAISEELASLGIDVGPRS
jgi:hypothetical protein